MIYVFLTRSDLLPTITFYLSTIHRPFFSTINWLFYFNQGTIQTLIFTMNKTSNSFSFKSYIIYQIRGYCTKITYFTPHINKSLREKVSRRVQYTYVVYYYLILREIMANFFVCVTSMEINKTITHLIFFSTIECKFVGAAFELWYESFDN